MSMLFDTSPIESPEQQKKSARARSGRTPPETQQEPEKTPLYIRAKPLRAILPIGTIDHTYQCSDQRCGAKCHDILHEEGGEWLLGCCFCNCTQWVRAIPGHLQPKEAEFAFRDGRFAGMTLSETAEQPHGRDYIQWAAKSHQRPAVKDACKLWLTRSE